MNTKYNTGAHKKGKEPQLRMNVLTKVFLNIQKDDIQLADDVCIWILFSSVHFIGCLFCCLQHLIFLSVDKVVCRMFVSVVPFPHIEPPSKLVCSSASCLWGRLLWELQKAARIGVNPVSMRKRQKLPKGAVKITYYQCFQHRRIQSRGRLRSGRKQRNIRKMGSFTGAKETDAKDQK